MADKQLNHSSTSNNVRSVRWDDETLTLTVEFKGGTYQASGVDEDTALGFERSDSAGSYWNQNIKGSYPISKV